jgi:hypothetical protein
MKPEARTSRVKFTDDINPACSIEASEHFVKDDNARDEKHARNS